MVVSDSDQKDGRKQDVDLDALRALANAVVTVDSNIPSGGTSQIPAAHLSVPTAGPPGASTVPPGASIVPPGASTVLAGSPSVPANVFPSVNPAGVSNKGKSLMVEEDFPVKARTFKQIQEDILGEQEEVLDSAMYYIEADWLNIMAHVEANAYISKTLLGDDVSKENFPARMAALLRRKKQALAEKLAKERQNIPMTQAQQRAYIQIQAFSMTLKRSGPMLEEPSSKRQKSTEATILSMPELPHSPATFIKVVVNEDSDDEAFPVWFALVGWEVIPTPLGDINALYRIDGGKGSCVWQHQNLWEIRSWRLYTLSSVHVLETVSGEVLYMFTNVSYPLSVKLMERMLTHKLEIDMDIMGNDMTTAE
nr:JmjC domain-containing protein [Tanacetum cinerariifolium]